MTTPKPASARQEASRRVQELQEKLLAELTDGARTMRQLTATFGLERDVIYRALLKMQDAGIVATATDRRKNANGVVGGATWTLSGRPLPPRTERRAKPRRPPEPIPLPPRDPLIWALFRTPQAN